VGVTASWHEGDGQALNRIMFRARHNDLVVVGRAQKPNGLPADFLESLLVKTRGATHELLASVAQNHRADLVVLGAFGHPQMRQRLFGGCTQFFIRNARQPVLMMH
jgi:nucleotide-binding universal stress UspA family protein